jgi:signal transduction histidine kinase
MDRATARHVFRPGFSTKRRGWGLGLSLARRIVDEYHAGHITVDSSAPGEGATFKIVLEAADPVVEPAPEPTNT